MSSTDGVETPTFRKAPYDACKGGPTPHGDCGERKSMVYYTLRKHLKTAEVRKFFGLLRCIFDTDYV
jgi:hypothetical protein